MAFYKVLISVLGSTRIVFLWLKKIYILYINIYIYIYIYIYDIISVLKSYSILKIAMQGIVQNLDLLIETLAL